MKIKKIQRETLEFEVEGELDGAFIGTNQFSYQLAPHHPEHGSVFIIYTHTSIKGNVSGEIKFKGRITYFFEADKIKPTVKELLNLTNEAIGELNVLLETQIIEKTEYNPIKIFPSDEEDTIKTLQQNLLVAYPEN